jgi:O-antigen/teichoic acid export membrane protein
MKTLALVRRSVPALFKGKIAQGSLGTLLLKAGNAALGVLVAAVFARFLGAEGYGIYAIAMAWVSLLTIAAGLGLPQLLVREVSAGIARGRYGEARGILRWSTLAAVSTALALAATLALGAYWTWRTQGSAQALALVFAATLIPLNVLNQLRQSSLRALGNVFLAQLPEMALQPLLSVSAFLAIVYVVRLDPAPTTAILSAFSAAFIGLAVGSWLLLRLAPRPLRSTHPEYHANRWLSSALPLAALSAMQVIVVNTDVVMLGWLADEGAAGVYRVSSRLAELVAFAAAAISMPLAPRVAELYSTGDRAAVQNLMTRTARWSFAVGLLAVAVYALFGDRFLQVFGDEFSGGLSVLVVLSVARLITAFTGPVGLYLTMMGHEREAVKAIFFAMLANIALNFALIPAYGAIGAAIATGITLLLWVVLLSAVLTRKTGLRANIFPVRSETFG